MEHVREQEVRRPLPHGWSLALPSSWQCEVVEDNFQEHVFYPPDGPLTVRVTVFRLERDGVPAPKEALEQVYRMSAPQGVRLEEMPRLAPAGFGAVGFRHVAKEEPNVVWAGCGAYGPEGELISFNAFSESAQEAVAALDYMLTLEKRPAP